MSSQLNDTTQSQPIIRFALDIIAPPAHWTRMMPVDNPSRAKNLTDLINRDVPFAHPLLCMSSR